MGYVRKLPGKHTVRFTLVQVHCSLSKVSPGAPLYREHCKFMAVYCKLLELGISCWVHPYSLAIHGNPPSEQQN